mgnify:FL=1
MSRTIVYFHVYILLDFPITYRNASVLIIRMSMSTSNSKHESLKNNERESTHAHVQSCPSNEKRALPGDVKHSK